VDLDQELGRRLKAGLQRHEPMSLHTSWKVGGPADYYAYPADLTELVEIVRCAAKYNLPLFVLGNGTNLLVLDGGIRGMVLHIGTPFHYINWEGSRLTAGAGTPMPFLARATTRKGLTGLEFAGGIPGTLGGALMMNAGAFGGSIGALVREVKLVRGDGAVCTLDAAAGEVEFSYRRSSLAGRGVIVEALLQLQEDAPASLERRMEGYLAERLSRHPQLPSAGSVFRNLPGQPAGQLIEAAGGKGMRIGGAQVSEQHANFIVNLGGATAADILALIEAVQELVKNKFGTELQTEVRVAGE
jgi:UDP-N-acetylmuramate dehydrogenase